ncbi:hypothetical protein PG995_004145 [Apiospora arundinis]
MLSLQEPDDRLAEHICCSAKDGAAVAAYVSVERLKAYSTPPMEVKLFSSLRWPKKLATIRTKRYWRP